MLQLRLRGATQKTSESEQKPTKRADLRIIPFQRCHRLGLAFSEFAGVFGKQLPPPRQLSYVRARHPIRVGVVEPVAFLARPRYDRRTVKDFGDFSEIQMSQDVTDWGVWHGPNFVESRFLAMSRVNVYGHFND